MRSEAMHLSLSIALSILLWIPSNLSAPAPCSSFVMSFSAAANCDLGRAGVVILIVSFMVIVVSALIVGWNATRPRIRRFRYVEGGEHTEPEYSLADSPSSSSGQNRTKFSSIYYSFGLFIPY